MKLDSVVFYTNDLEKVTSFYEDVMGFEVEYIQDGRFASFIFPNGAKLGIKQRKEEREVPGHQTVFISTDNIDDIYKQMQEKNVEIAKKLVELEDWGKNFSIYDPDRNKVQFVELKN